MDMKMSCQSLVLRILIIYRSPPSSTNNSSTSLYLDEFGMLLEQYITMPGTLMIAGGCNFHIDDESDLNTRNFPSLLETFNLLQQYNMLNIQLILVVASLI